jgi:hypothetical protein
MATAVGKGKAQLDAGSRWHDQVFIFAALLTELTQAQRCRLPG